MSPGDAVDAFVVATAPFGQRLLAERRRLEVEICYCSSLGECWSLDAPGMASPKTELVVDCRPDPKPFVSLSEQFLDQLARYGFADAGDGGTSSEAAHTR